METALLRSDRPVLMVPDTHRRSGFSCVVIAWDASTPCVRAVAAALPVLAVASRVNVNSVSEICGDHPEPWTLVPYLISHGVQVSEIKSLSESKTTGHSILQSADSAAAGLMVMGEYENGRLRETVRSGSTRRLLRNSQISPLPDALSVKGGGRDPAISVAHKPMRALPAQPRIECGLISINARKAE